jgi:Ca2+/Na+ antiporter
MFIKHVADWWLIGTHDNVNWGWDMWDQCNQFVLEGQTGGLVALTCFIAMIAICFRKIGIARKAVEGDPKKEWLFWLLGAVLFAQVMVFIGLDYFDQSKFVWYALLAMIPVATMSARKSAARNSQRALVPDPIPDMSTSGSTSALTNGGRPARPTISSSSSETTVVRGRLTGIS